MEEGIIREFGTDMNTLLHLKWITNKDLLYSTGNSAPCYVAAGLGGGLGRKDTCMFMTESLRCPPETITTLLICFMKKVKVLADQSCLILCDPMGYSPPDSSVHGIFQARILSRLPFPTPGDLPDPGIEPTSPALAGRFSTAEPPGKPHVQPRSQSTAGGKQACRFPI